jgi:hypothetical protein
MGILLSWSNLAEGSAANLAVSSEAAGLGLRAVLTPQISDIWRSTAWGATTINLRVDLGSVQSLGLIAIAAPRDGLLPSAGATVRLTADAATLDGGAALDTGSQSLGTAMASFGLWASAAPISARYLRLQLTGAASDAYLQLGRLWVGPALVTMRQASYGYSIGASDPGSNARAPLTGVRDVQRGRPYRTLAFTGDTLTTAEAAQVEQAALAAGSTGQVFAARLHTDPARTGCFGVFSRAPTLTRVANALWRADFSLEEDL